MDKISFGARKIQTIQVLKLTDKGYQPCEADIVRYNSLRLRDWKKVEKLKNKWNCHLIDRLFERCMDFDFTFCRKNVFFITEPQKYKAKDKFDPEKVLGAALFVQYPLRRYNYLEILQKNPEYINPYYKDSYKHVGKSFLDFFKLFFHKKDIIVNPTYHATPFYVRNGFIPLNEEKNKIEYIWKS